jgi:basic membrane protein A
VAHEALIREWPTLREWVEDNREGLRLHRHLTEAAQEWERSGRDPESLYRSGRLMQARGWAEAHGDDMNRVEQQFLDSSIAEVERVATEREGQSQIQNALRMNSALIVAMYSEASDAMAAAAQANPDRRFLGLDSFSDLPMDNFWQQAYASDQPAFLAGYAAAFMTRTGKVGTFGGAAKKSVEDFMDGFARGVTYYNDRNGTSVQVLGWDVANREGLFISTFTDAGAATAITQRLLDEGADIILPVAGVFLGRVAMEAVQEHGNAYVVGVDQDWATVYPQYSDIVLTSIEKRWGVSEGLAVVAIENGTFKGGTHLGTLATGEVSLSPFYQFDALISPEVKAELEQIRADIIAGRIKTRP